MRTLWSMFMKSWAILGSNKHIVCSKHNIGGEGCNYKFNNCFLHIWCVTLGIFQGTSTWLKTLTNYGFKYQWNLDFSNPLSLTNMFRLWSSIFPKWLELMPLLDRNERPTFAFLNRIFNRFGFSIEVFIN
jgi:hypothetical protein